MDPRDAGRFRAALEQCCPQDAATGGVPGVVLLDRTHRYTGAIAALHPVQIIYVACDPVALARDTATLRASGYRLDDLRALDLFPNTHHVESVARFIPEEHQ